MQTRTYNAKTIVDFTESSQSGKGRLLWAFASVPARLTFDECSDSGASSHHQFSGGNKRPRPDTQHDVRGKRKNKGLKGTDLKHTSDGKHVTNNRIRSLMSTDRSYRLSAQNLRLLESQMDQACIKPRRRGSQSPPSLIVTIPSFPPSGGGARGASLCLCLCPPTDNDLPRLVSRWLQDPESGKSIVEESEGCRDREESVRLVDDAIQYSKRPPLVLAPGSCLYYQYTMGLGYARVSRVS